MNYVLRNIIIFMLSIATCIVMSSYHYDAFITLYFGFEFNILLLQNIMPQAELL